MQLCFWTIVTFLFTHNLNAKDGKLLDWSATNIQLLQGNHYKIGDETRTIATFEHANGWKYGDFFIFADQIWQDDGQYSYYVEPTLRFSLSKIFDRDLSYRLLRDVLIATHIEKAKGNKSTKLNGVAFDFNLPGFNFFKTHAFLRDNPNLSGSTYQITFAWNSSFKIKNVNFLIEGFADFAGGEDDKRSNQLIVPRFLIDVGQIIKIKENKLWAGIEWQYWHNKLGLDGVTESVPQLQLKYVF